MESALSSKFGGRHITLEALLDSPGMTPSPFSESVNDYQPLEATDHGSPSRDAIIQTPTTACTTSTVDQQACRIPRPSETERLRLLRDHCIELLFVLRNQDVNGYLLSFAPRSGQKDVTCTGLLDIEKKLLSSRYRTLKDFKLDVCQLFSCALQHYVLESEPHNEAQRLMNVVSDWFNSLSADVVEFLNSESSLTESANFVPGDPVYAKSTVPAETSLGILNPDNRGVINKTERIRTLGDEVGPLRSGLHLLPNGGYREDRRNKIVPYTYLDYGPFYSFAPHYDSGASHCTPEAHQLVLGTAWLPARSAYLTRNIPSDVQPTEDVNTDDIGKAIHSEAVRSALAIGDHQLAISLAVADMEDRASARLAAELDEILPGPEVDEDCVFSICLANALTRDYLSSTQGDPAGMFKYPVDASKFGDSNSVNVDLDDIDDACDPCLTDGVQSRSSTDMLADHLSESAADLVSLYNAQYLRLGDTSQGSVLAGLTVTPNETETAIAHRLVGRLINLTKRARPRDLVHPYAVRRAMGLPPDIAPLPDESFSNLDTTVDSRLSPVDDITTASTVQLSE